MWQVLLLFLFYKQGHVNINSINVCSDLYSTAWFYTFEFGVLNITLLVVYRGNCNFRIIKWFMPLSNSCTSVSSLANCSFFGHLHSYGLLV